MEKEMKQKLTENISDGKENEIETNGKYQRWKRK